MGNGFHIKKPDNKWFQWADKIIISSFEQQQELLSFTEKQGYAHKAVKLYDEADRVPFYIAEIEMNAEKMQDICLENEYGWIDPYSAWQYSGQGKWYEDHVEKDFFHTVTKNYYLRYIDSGMNVLDVGAGTGRLSVEVYKKGAEVTAVDTSVSMLNILKEKEPGIKTVIVDNEKLPFQENVFDRVVSCDAMIHFPNWRDFLREHLRVVRQGGFLIYNMYNDDHLMQISDKRFIRASYIAGGKNYYVTVSRKELEQFCEESGNVKLMEMIPYNFFSQTAYSYGILTRQEMFKLQEIYDSLCRNKIVAEVIEEFEKNIVAVKQENLTACNICVFRKI